MLPRIPSPANALTCYNALQHLQKSLIGNPNPKYWKMLLDFG